MPVLPLPAYVTLDKLVNLSEPQIPHLLNKGNENKTLSLKYKSKLKCWTYDKVKSLSRVWLFATLWTVAHQALPSMGFSRQEY